MIRAGTPNPPTTVAATYAATLTGSAREAVLGMLPGLAAIEAAMAAEAGE